MIAQLPHIEVRLIPIPVPPGYSCNAIATAAVKVDGREVEPLLVLREVDGSLGLMSVETLAIGGVMLFDTRGATDLVRLDAMPVETRVRLRALVLERAEEVR